MKTKNEIILHLQTNDEYDFYLDGMVIFLVTYGS